MAAEGYRELFDERGGSYDDAMARWPEARAEELAFVVRLAEVRAGERVLDLPAGGGYLGDLLPAGASVTAVEPSAAFAERSRARGLEVVASSLDGEALPDGEADVLVSIAGIHHEPDHAALLRGWRRVLAPGGRLVLADVAAGSAPARFLDGFVGAHNGHGHAGTYLGDELAEQAEACGYTEVRVIDGTYRWWAPSLEELAAFCAGLFGLRGVSVGEVAEALAEGPGVDHEDGRTGLRWGLRALVATSP
ncbi:MAG: methyltransferase domain-containing protein [Acidimicrobiales bacterium]|nr:methyltransferase domain-containing protein [Acidimicrobiales bacterium]